MLNYKDKNNISTELTEPSVVEETTNMTPAAIAFLASGIGCAIYGLLIVMVEVSKDFKKFMTLSDSVGPLSGKVAGAVIFWLLSWAILYFTLRNRKLDFNKYFIASVALIVVGLVLSFPPFYEIFTAK